MLTPPLSLGAEFLLLSIDPAAGGLVVRRRRRRRVRRAVAAGAGSYRAAARELESAGKVQARRPFGRIALVDRQAAGSRLREIEQAIRDNTLSDERDIELFVLLAWSGVLAARFPRELRRLAARRLRQLGQTYAQADVPSSRRVPAAALEIPAIFLALGLVDLRHSVDAFDGLFDGSAGVGGGFGSFAGEGDGGGGDGGGGGGGDGGGGGN